MSDKRIEAERERLEVAAQKEREYYERQRQRFAPLAALLAEIKASVEPKYLNATVSEGLAIVRVGRLSGGQSEVALKWEIAPNGPDTSVDLGQCVSPGQHGFRIEETRYYNAISEFSESQHVFVFADATAVAEYLIAEIAKKVALYAQWEAMARSVARSRGQP